MSKKSFFLKEKKKQKIIKDLSFYNIKKNNINNLFFIRSRKKRSYSQRYRKRCYLTGRPRGYLNIFGLSRIVIRELISNMLIPGIIKASW